MAKMTKEEIITILLQNGVSRDLTAQYTDVFLEYQEASENIDTNGLIVQHPRTMNPIDNPYLSIRDRALLKLQRMRGVNSKGLW
jgi:hypothetical protein